MSTNIAKISETYMTLGGNFHLKAHMQGAKGISFEIAIDGDKFHTKPMRTDDAEELGNAIIELAVVHRRNQTTSLKKGAK